ncbi:MAG: hypothetical protein IKF52_06650 [Clostridia bacterium]|nr:hypothetical protein [Clostridia bacterium]
MNKKIIKKITSGALLISMAAYAAPVLAFTKDETVYSKFDSNGNVKETIVNNHIKNINGDKSLEDLSNLMDIINIGGEENFTQNGEHLTWEANGSDIYYQGKSSQELPITINIKYELDGKEISKNDIIGKSGKVKVTLEYINNDKHEVYINNKYETLYTPFVVVCGTIIDNSNNKNINVTTGKVIDNGNQSYVLGIALPGMQESLGVSKSRFEIPSQVEITMDAKDFDMGSILVYATPRIIENKDLHLVDNLDEIFAKLDTLQSSSTQLKNGASELSNGADELATGAQTFSSKSHEFNSAVNQISNGTSLVNSNYETLDNGINTLNSGASNLNAGATELNNGINTLTTSLSSLPGTISQIYTGTTGVANGLDSVSNGVDSLISSAQTSTTSLATALTKASASADNTIAVFSANNQALQSAIDSLDPTTQADLIAALQNQIIINNSAISSAQTSKAEAQAGLADIQEKSSSSQTSITTLKQGIATLKSTMAQINSGLGTLNSSTGSLNENLSKLSAGSNALAEGSSKLASGTSELSNGSSQLKSGINSLDTNTQKLAQANNQLTDGADTLSNGATKLSEGAKTLADGVAKFDSEGIQAICNFINGDIKDLSTRIKKLKELSEKYQSFTMSNNKNEGNVKFIYVIDKLKKDSKENTKAVEPNERKGD